MFHNEEGYTLIYVAADASTATFAATIIHVRTATWKAQYMPSTFQAGRSQPGSTRSARQLRQYYYTP
jgi:hypothetical protein